MIKTIILDFDGVVIESVDIKTQAFKDLFKHRPELAAPFVEYHLKNNGKSRFAKFEWLYKNILKKPLPAEEKEALGNKFSQLVLKKILECPYVDGALEFIQKHHADLPIYVASITPQAELEAIIDKRDLKKYFRGIIGGIGKKAELIDKILKREKRAPQECLFVGDTKEDYIAAKETKVFFLARINKDKFEGIEIPKFNDFIEIDNYVKGIIDQALI